jgi:hypothetical protein
MRRFIILILLTNFSLSFSFFVLVFCRPFLLPFLVSDQRLIKQKIKGKRTAPHVFPGHPQIFIQFLKPIVLQLFKWLAKM